MSCFSIGSELDGFRDPVSHLVALQPIHDGDAHVARPDSRGPCDGGQGRRLHLDVLHAGLVEALQEGHLLLLRVFACEDASVSESYVASK